MPKSAYKPAGLENVPLPEPRRGASVRLTFVAIIAVAILAAGGWWLTRTPDERAGMRSGAGEKIAEFLDGTPFSRLSAFFRPVPPPLPPELINPPTAAGTLAGREIAATVATPMDFGGIIMPRQEAGEQDASAGSGSAQGSEVQFSQEPLAPVSEDSRIRPGYVSGLAQWLASHYRPGQNGGIHAGVQALNQECGGKLAAFAEGGRGALLRYAFHPAMIQGLYDLYIPKFMADLDAAAGERGLSQAQNQQFHRSIAGGAALLASCLDGILRVPDLTAKLGRIDSLAQKAVDANADLTTAVFELDELGEAKAPQQARNAAQMRVDAATARYRRASGEHARAQTALASEIRRYSGQNLDDDSLLFMAAWVGRRYADSGQARGAIRSCIAVLRDLSARCAKAGGAS